MSNTRSRVAPSDVTFGGARFPSSTRIAVSSESNTPPHTHPIASAPRAVPPKPANKVNVREIRPS